MAFFDKLSDFAKNIGDKTTDAIETGKLTAKISSEKNLAGEELKKIGEFYYSIWLERGEIAPEALDFCTAAKAHYDAAGEAQAEIDRIHAENEAARASAPAASAGAVCASCGTQLPEQTAAESAVCPGCGHRNDVGTKFCAGCGAKLPELGPAEKPVCEGCGEEFPEGVKFCPSCGTKAPEVHSGPTVITCPGCGKEFAPGVKFCGECGTRL